MKSKSSMSEVTVQVSIPIEGNQALPADLTVPEFTHGLVLFAHGSGSSVRFSPRNSYIKQVLNDAGLATLLIDMLTPQEELSDLRTHQFHFDIAMLANRLVEIINWIAVYEKTEGLKIGLFGASTGAAAAIVAATQRPTLINAIVARGGRPELARDSLSQLTAPTLLIAGEKDDLTLSHNALEMMPCKKQLTVVRGATHQFEERGAIQEVAKLAESWFSIHLG